MASPDVPAWSGRLLLTVDALPPQQLAAFFELSGSPEQGLLTLSSVLGTTLATAQWQPGQAELNSQGARRTFATPSDLIESMTGTRLPVATLFGWLQGRNERAEGWEVNLEQFAQGRIRAQRLDPLPNAEIRLVLDTVAPALP